MFDQIKQVFDHFINPGKNAALTEHMQQNSDELPTLWLLGKTGAGKSSLISAVTGDSDIDVGRGFKPCTQTSQSYQFPADKPLLRFLDTRGLAEADYDASEDIAACENSSNAVLVVMKLDDPEQSAVLAALAQIKRSKKLTRAILVHTGVDLIADADDIERCRLHNLAQVESVWRDSLPSVMLNLVEPNSETTRLDELTDLLSEEMPLIALLQQQSFQQDQEQLTFLKVRNEVLWYAGIAGSSDAIPAVGLVSVPVLQGKMIHSLATQYDLNWGKREFSEFLATLGTGFGIHYSARLGVRQLVKFIPVYGQTIGAASAAVISFSTTYALGRVAAKYLFHKCRGEDVSKESLQALYTQALKSVEKVATNVENHKDR